MIVCFRFELIMKYSLTDVNKNCVSLSLLWLGKSCKNCKITTTGKGIMKKISYKEVLKWAGNENRLAKKLGVTRQSISGWKGKVPEMRQFQIMILMMEEKKARDKVHG
jgi:hypothetical protein